MAKKIKCNECHQVPSSPFDAGHTDTPRFASGTITFSQASTAIKNTTTPASTSGSAGGAARCDTTYCHGSNMPKGDTGGNFRNPLWNASLTGAPSLATCGACHGNPPIFGLSSSAHIGSVATTSCNGCHKTVTDGVGNIINKSLHLNGSVERVVDTTLTAACNKCHGNPPQGGVVKYGRYSGLVKPATLALGASPANIGAHAKHAANGLTCNTCHNNFTVSHPDNKLQIFFRITSATITGWNTTAQRAPYGTYSGNSGGIAIDASSTLIRTTASTNNSCNTYCHGGWTNSNRNMNPRWTSGAAATACGACHGASAAAPPQIGTHARHAGYSSALTARQGYSFACLKCHPSRTAGAHVKGAVHVRFSTAVLGTTATYTKTGATFSAPAGVRQYQTQGLAGDTADGTCSNISCHSNARATGMGTTQYATTPAWGTTTRNCLSCHGGRASATGAPARSTANFTLSTTHSQHLKYPAANINCQICHSKTATDAATLKNFTGIQHHANGVRDVTFTGITYGSYTSYKSTEAGSGSSAKTCTNTACHGGKSRSAWSATTTNNDNTCVHCHGTTGTSAALPNTAANRKYFAPGWNKTGTSTDQTASSNDYRVGSHFKHLSSVYMKAIKCNECHTVPATAFDGTHMGTPRYNSQTLTFGQASSARILLGVAAGSTPAQLAAFAGYTTGTAIKAASCSSVYCHGSRLKTGDTSGKYRKPYWNYSAMVNYTDPNNACAQCHGNPPTTGTAAATHSGKAATTSCNPCHPATVNASGQIIDKTKHINGQVEFYSHVFPYPGASHATAAGTTPWTGCTGCHTNGSNTTYPVAKGVAPDCRGCHTLALSTTPSGISACSDCHGASVTDGRPNGAAFPNWSGNHTRHVVNQAIACSTCHGNSGGNIGDTRHGFSNRTAHSFALGFVNVTSATTQYFKWARVDSKTGSCSTNACHATATWGNKFACNSCHAYLATDTWTSTNYGGTALNESAGAHVKHINYLITRNNVVGWSANDSYGSANFTSVCGTCHSINPTDHSMLKTVNTRTINFGGSAARQFGASAPTYNGVTGTSSSVNPKSCSNTDCHFRTSPVWSTY
jgi:predicted CxxxxCH...CXXCH cytochrome family protein